MSASDAELALLATAQGQGGYFTTKQALAAGYSYPTHHYHVQTGQWIRCARAVYRLRSFPEGLRDDLIVLTLMSSGRTGEPQAVVSHETALVVHDISDANPAKIHMTVPPGFRVHMPSTVVLHRARLSAREWESRGGYRVTTPLRTIIDIASDPVSWPLLDGAVRDALREGMVRGKLLLSADVSDEAKARLRSALNAAQHSSVGVQDTKTGSTNIEGITWHTSSQILSPYHTSAAVLHGAKDGDRDR